MHKTNRGRETSTVTHHLQRVPVVDADHLRLLGVGRQGLQDDHGGGERGGLHGGQ